MNAGCMIATNTKPSIAEGLCGEKSAKTNSHRMLKQAQFYTASPSGQYVKATSRPLSMARVTMRARIVATRSGLEAPVQTGRTRGNRVSLVFESSGTQRLVHAAKCRCSLFWAWTVSWARTESMRAGGGERTTPEAFGKAKLARESSQQMVRSRRVAARTTIHTRGHTGITSLR